MLLCARGFCHLYSSAHQYFPFLKCTPPTSVENDIGPIASTCQLAKVIEGFTLSRPPPLARLVDPQPGPNLAVRIQDGDLITNSGFFDHPTACVQATSEWKVNDGRVGVFIALCLIAWALEAVQATYSFWRLQKRIRSD